MKPDLKCDTCGETFYSEPRALVLAVGEIGCNDGEACPACLYLESREEYAGTLRTILDFDGRRV